MNKLILLLVLLLCSCTNDKPTNIQAAATKTDVGSNYSDQFASPLTDSKYVENQKIQSIYNRVAKGIQPDMPKDSIKKVLQAIHYWDQVYRDSLMEGNSWISDKIKRDKYSKEMATYDKMNQKIVLHLLNTIGGWPDTREMGDEAKMAIYLVIIHHSNTNRKFSQQILPYLNEAYYLDSLISNKMYAKAFDEIQSTLGGDSKYGTLPFNKKYHSDSAVNKINLERTAIGLEKL